MRKKLVLILLPILAVASLGFLFYSFGPSWVGRSPYELVHDTLAEAKKNNFDGAKNNFDSDSKKRFADSPETWKRHWVLLTLGGTMIGFDVIEQSITKNLGRVRYRITYHGGLTFESEVYCKLEGWSWKHGLLDFPEAKSLKGTLDPHFTDVENTRISLRLPVGCIWEADSKAYSHPILRLRIAVADAPGTTLNELTRKVSEYFKSIGATLSHEEVIPIDSTKGALFEARYVDKYQQKWVSLALVVGDNKYSTQLIANILDEAPESLRLVRESLLGAKWMPPALDQNGKKATDWI